MGWRAVVSENGKVTGYRETSTGERISVQEFERRHMMEQGGSLHGGSGAHGSGHPQMSPMSTQGSMQHTGVLTIEQPRHLGSSPITQPALPAVPTNVDPVTTPPIAPQVQPNMPPNMQQTMPSNAQGGFVDAAAMPMQQSGQMPTAAQQMPISGQQLPMGAQQLPIGAQQIDQQGQMPNAGMPTSRTLRDESRLENHDSMASHLGYERHSKGFLDATSLLLPSLGLIVVFFIIVTLRVKKIRKQRQEAKDLAEKQGREI